MSINLFGNIASHIKGLLKEKNPAQAFLDSFMLKATGSLYLALCGLYDVATAIFKDGFQWHDLMPLLGYESIGATIFMLLFGVQYVKKRGKQ